MSPGETDVSFHRGLCVAETITLMQTARRGTMRILRGDAESGRRDLALDLFAFAGTVAWATFFRWEARDVIRGLWISSLVVGYATIVSIIFRGARSVSVGSRVLAGIGGLGALAFFTFHFGMFHFVHGVFLNAFFPLLESENGFPNLFAMAGRSFASFWPLVVASFLSRLSDVFPSEPVPAGKDPFVKPYGNVVRMHLLIFVFAGLTFLDLTRLAIIPVLAAYFFPWKAVKEYFRKK